MVLSPEELAELTGKRRAAAQIAELKAMGIPFRIRRDGKPTVLRVVVMSELGHSAGAPAPSPKLHLPGRAAR